MRKRRESGTASGAARKSANDIELFRQAVQDVAPLTDSGKVVHDRTPPSPIPVQTLRDESEALADSLSDHVDSDTEMETGEELSFLRSGLSRQILRKLRRGHWVIEDQLDLHGLNRSEARMHLAEFLGACGKRGLRCVRIIHGKGRGSRNREPVLKNAVRSWLMQRDEVLAFCQARPMDGGGGAAVVLLKARTKAAA